MKVALLIPTFNEIIGLRQIMPMINREWVDEIVFVDGNSTDGSIEYIRENNYTLFLEKVPGVRRAMIEAIRSVTSDVLITFSPDGNCLPELIPKLVDKMREGYDMVIVSRYADGAKSYDDNIITGFGNWLFTNTINFLHGGSYTDVMGIYRAYKKELVSSLDLDKDITYTTPEKLFRTRLFWEPILSTRAAKRKLKITEIAGDEPKRIGGEAKLQTIKWGAAYMYQVLRDKVWWK
ncbi:glycosyltransferase family 2 protein [Candidatus Magnetominusculus xianensis]|uniref:Histidinol phosphate phosphatase n=1 Tax=Candidatus Magnetominusculus xianensis TaxID=1748249 RepID=A0ABR5SJL9_9BACT|nr:glycosyltransferase family 2 protein [Candidatus Magnetominusculus xianensis]KWT92777.1 histidinol phosphate phosphatase [Candidatus Magnetominusculus xianensis]MBF0405231.1 glycosyltransferase family 2 protein [Nitrospirota bacterium]